MATKPKDTLRSQIGQFAMVPAWLLDACQDSRAIHLYAVIGKYANREFIAWPSRELLAGAIGVSLPSLTRTLKVLRDAGALKTRLRHRQSDGAVIGLEYLLVQIDPDHADAADSHQKLAGDSKEEGGESPRRKKLTREPKAPVHQLTTEPKATDHQKLTGEPNDAPPSNHPEGSFESPVILGSIGRTRSSEPDHEEQERERASGAQAPLLSVQTVTLSPEGFRQLWNETTTRPLPRCLALTDVRRRHVRARIAERPLDEWRAVMARIEASRFCRGENDRGWVASFTWLIKSAEAGVKVLEGLYDDRRKAERAFAANELDHARHVLRSVGRCPHDPPCENHQACIATIIRRRRGEAA